MADDEEFEGDVVDYDGNNSRSDSYDSDRRSKERERHHRRRDSDRSRDDDSRHKRRRSRSRSGSRERTSSRSGREGSRHRDRHRHTSDDDGAYGSSRRNDHDEGRSRSHNRRDRRDDDYQSNERICGHDWRSKLTSIRDAHFNRSKQAPTSVQNQFKNDGSFMEMFKKKMAEQSAKGEDTSSLTPNSLVLASSSIPFSPDLSLPPLTTAPIDVTSGGMDADEDLDGVPIPTHKSLPVPVSVGKRRLAKPLKTGIVLKKPQEPEEDEASQEKLDAWSRYLQEVQKYKSANCIDEDNSRPLVK